MRIGVVSIAPELSTSHASWYSSELARAQKQRNRAKTGKNATANATVLRSGAATASEAMRLYERGYDMLKFFPAEAAGGAPFLKSLSSPLPQVRFCPTGGVSLKNAETYLGLSNTLCVGGSWVAPKDAVDREDWAEIERLASEAAALTRR